MFLRTLCFGGLCVFQQVSKLTFRALALRPDNLPFDLDNRFLLINFLILNTELVCDIKTCSGEAKTNYLSASLPLVKFLFQCIVFFNREAIKIENSIRLLTSSPEEGS